MDDGGRMLPQTLAQQWAVKECWAGLPEANRRSAVWWLAVLAIRVVAVRLPGAGPAEPTSGIWPVKGTAMTAVMAWERLGGKVTARHLDLLAVVYERQSTWQQVIDHGESTRLQYALVERAVGLGWAASRVMVIDEDLGKSGSSAIGRVGFQRLVTAPRKRSSAGRSASTPDATTSSWRPRCSSRCTTDQADPGSPAKPSWSRSTPR
jgi:hypothetical protein